MNWRVLVVDDEPDILKVVCRRLAADGYLVEIAHDGREALKKFQEYQPHVVVLDVMLPELDGLEVCRLVREKSAVPIVFLSARTDEIDKLVGFRVGADDYMVKPFSPSELKMRLDVLVRRCYRGGIPAEYSNEVLSFGDIRIDKDRREVTARGKKVELTAKEFDVLWHLASKPNHVISKEMLLQLVWHSDYAGDLNNVSVLIRRLREKLEEDPAMPRMIKTVWGSGYKLEVD
ncbi:MAG: response regulator transcription factor [Bacillota bacterium]